ncbi:hypothetical protein EU537_11805 [Candidatus Thorarchaeota archaeon]|nr:MAG: hypothetical protein EU537_11805 [Candidatus Thorarchaeota archaeon]
MITSGRRMLKAIGIEIDIKPYTTRFHKRTGRVSVAWYAVPKDLYEPVKLGILAPLNDLRKRNIVKKMLTKHPEEVFDAMQDLEGRGIRIQKWWMEE